MKIIYELQIKKWIWGNLCSNKVQCYLGSVSQVLCKPALRHDQLPVGLSAQFLEHCMGIADGMDSNPVQAWIFSGLIFHYCVNSVHCCEDCFHITSLSTVHIYDLHTFTVIEVPRQPLICIDQLIWACPPINLFLTLVGDPHRKESENGCSCLRKFLLHINCLFILFQCC